ncbi:LARGE xylosyl- and glucuronyltransferase 2-like isoform X2 [Venturia canescens]|uniref:LARGE xylosyl- and glucuronyltransferase 2-like isoform X2 n=1 Tax=Venturia canescens TaxID=32260 RepID=UPI001C9C4934|nr:LARGE xylosyl- and glucuronyltransferase 2-like isoform X2 [Venturia canescens]
MISVNVSFYAAEKWIPRVSWIPNTHYSGVYGLLKLTLPEALSSVERVLVLDTDVTFLEDVRKLWEYFEEFEEVNLVGLVENQSDWYVRTLSYGSRPWPAQGRGFNTGIMLMDLSRLRLRKFAEMWQQTTKQVLEDIPETRLADQDIINAIIKRYPSIVYILECTWNIQLSDHTLSESCYGDGQKINIIHWNSPRKQDVRNKYVEDFRKVYQTFVESDGNLLRRRLFGCDRTEISYSIDSADVCSKFVQGSSIIYRTHLFLLEYEYNVDAGEKDVALVTQCSVDRIMLLEELCKHWPGTISVALYLSDAEVENFLGFVRNSEDLKNRKNIAYHVVYKEGEFYPVNYLRNTAMSYVSTSFIFQLDIDFLPQYGLYENLMLHISNMKLSVLDKTALIVPAFETQRYRFTFPTNKQELIKYLNHGILFTFRYHVWTKGHAATNYTHWKSASQPYEVEWEPDFEPYLVISRSAPRYDQRFIGFGWNKVSYVTHLTALGYKYIVLPDTFIIHRPHAPSLDIGKFRNNPLYRRCLKKLKDTFVQELVAEYGKENASKLKIIAKDEKVPKTLRLK